jgi:hypothetical protein
MLFQYLCCIDSVFWQSALICIIFDSLFPGGVSHLSCPGWFPPILSWECLISPLPRDPHLSSPGSVLPLLPPGRTKAATSSDHTSAIEGQLSAAVTTERVSSSGRLRPE